MRGRPVVLPLSHPSFIELAGCRKDLFECGDLPIPMRLRTEEFAACLPDAVLWFFAIHYFNLGDECHQSPQFGEHKIPEWFTQYADWYAPTDRCSYCWWGRGALSHWVLGVPVGYIAYSLPILLIPWGVALGVIVYLQSTDRYGKDSKKGTAE